MENNPKSIYKALKYVRAAVNNRKALFGSKANYSTRLVSFQDDCIEPATDEAYIRTLHDTRRDSSEKLEGLVSKLIGLMERKDQPSSRSPTPPSSPQRRCCYLCKGYGHLQRDCPQSRDKGRGPGLDKEDLNFKGLGGSANTQSSQ
jgi:hypothetical protein